MPIDLAASFREIGLCDGDIVFVHSALRKLGAIAGGADTVIDALLEAVAPNGTIAVPTHTWKVVNTEQPVFHQTLTPSNVGVLTNVFRKRAGAIRSLHPTHSVAAIGPRATELVQGHEHDDTPCSPTSPYGRLRDWGGKILIIGADLRCCTFFHGCEQWAGMTWAVREEAWPLFSITADGCAIEVPTRTHFVNTWDQYPNFEPGLLACGAMRIGHLGDCPVRLLDCRATAAFVIEELRRDPKVILPADLSNEF